ncbi:hypothetical protein [Oceanobacillus sp. J11TS1]|uniref:hypothetical protein n=1 Tax=Oceanobacillus sp. J11TS1 TaxID=2807191 RepID=UPI001B260BF2|nr:hypothetical protein [Oceanobacillus sp. J11TS1]GIO24337.1 hypothetical protein J11TS1_29180 [Oceanobacillus sp. J11TS1]
MQYQPFQQPFQQAYASTNGMDRNNPYLSGPSNMNYRNTRQELTPYDLFSKPELPTQYLMSQSQAQSAANNGAENGNNPLDFDTVISKVGKIASTYHQVSPIVKQFSTFVKGFM